MLCAKKMASPSFSNFRIDRERTIKSVHFNNFVQSGQLKNSKQEKESQQLTKQNFLSFNFLFTWKHYRINQHESHVQQILYKTNINHSRQFCIKHLFLLISHSLPVLTGEAGTKLAYRPIY